MLSETGTVKIERRAFAGAGVEIVGDAIGDDRGRPVLLLHGGGQTRHSWSSAAMGLASRGYYAVSIDLRGHGDSGWAEGGAYAISAYRDDAIAVARQLPARPVLAGASLGGIASMLAAASGEAIARGLVLVDITPRVEREGVRRIHAFMTARPDGFASLDEAADAVAAYNPERPRPANPSGLLKNLRLREGRYFWHWDPAMLANRDSFNPEYAAELDAAARKVRVPTRLVRGLQSDIVSDETVAHMREIIPHADFVDIGGAGHMVAGDRNDAFNAAVFSFLEKHGL